jgi:DNA polymerase V
MPVFALVDCNSFYCSCEELINPKLKGRPGVVLSNNDGMAVAINRLAKELGIGLDAFHLNRSKWDSMGVWYRSSNYPLYAEMSGRVMSTLKTFAPLVELYSVDEAFLDITGIQDYAAYGRLIKQTIEQWCGIPVSVGIARTKTLAKLANHLAKKSKKNRTGVISLVDSPYMEAALKRVPVKSVWGVGYRWGERLRHNGILTAHDLAMANRNWLLKKFNVVLTRTALELGGTFCLPLNLHPPTSKSIMHSMSFGRLLTELKELRQVLSTYASASAEKMRREELACTWVYVFLETNRFRDEPQYNPWIKLQLPHATDFTPEITEYALHGLESIYKDDYRYNKGGVLVHGLIPAGERQTNMFDPWDREKVARINQALDGVNSIFGPGTMRLGSQGFRNSNWRTRANHLSSITAPGKGSEFQHNPRMVELGQSVPLYRSL